MPTRIKRTRDRFHTFYEKADPYIRGALAVLLAVALGLLVLFALQARDSAVTAKVTAERSVLVGTYRHNQNVQQQKIIQNQNQTIIDEQKANHQLLTEVLALQAQLCTNQQQVHPTLTCPPSP